MRQHYLAYLISIRKLLPLVAIPIARMCYSLLSGTPIEIIIGSDVAVTAVLIVIRVLRVWAVKLTFTKTHIYLEKGIFIKSKSVIKRSEITEYYVSRSPILVLLKASKLEIYTFAGKAASLYLSACVSQSIK